MADMPGFLRQICNTTGIPLRSKFTAVMGDNGINITDMMNKSKGEYAYSMFDIETPVNAEIVAQLEAIEGVFRVRVVK